MRLCAANPAPDPYVDSSSRSVVIGLAPRAPGLDRAFLVYSDIELDDEESHEVYSLSVDDNVGFCRQRITKL